MNLSVIDISIIIGYFILIVTIGIFVSRRTSKNLDSYFLGGKSIPWYVLGISNSSGMFDITGTMWLVYAAVVYGMKSAWLPWLWPVFNQIVMMVFLSIWLRRSNVLTGAEWLKTRFGNGKYSEHSHIIVVIFALISAMGFLAYSFKGIGKFAAVFLPWDIHPDIYGVIIMGLTALYVIKGGMRSVVITEVVQFVVMTIASIAVGVIAMSKVSPKMLQKVIPDGWSNFFFSWNLDMDWTGILDSVNTRIEQDGYSMFGWLIMMMLFKGFFVSAAGPAPNYDMQRVLAAKTPKEAGLMSGFVNITLLFPRYLMVMGFTILSLVYLQPELQEMGVNIDFEAILPLAIQRFVPVGLLGLLLAGLLAAFMSTLAATVNAAPAYIVNDIYKKYINNRAEPKQYIKLSYLASILLLVCGIGVGFIVDSINDIMLWIVAALWGGYTASNILKWYWWRFNASGFFWGMAIGILAAFLVPIAFPNLSEIMSFPIIFVISIITAIIGTYSAPATDDDTLIAFYKNVRPWGFWEPIYKKTIVLDSNFKRNRNFKRDWFNIGIGIVWQLGLTALPMFLVIKEFYSVGLSLTVIIITSIILKKNWYDKLDKD